MATFKSDLITEQDARPQVFSNPGLVRGNGLKTKAVINPGQAIVTGDILQLARVKTNDVISAIRFKNDDLDSGVTGTTDLGLYDTEGNPVDIDAYGAALTFLRAENLDWSNQDLARAVLSQVRRVFEDVTPVLTSDPGTEYILALTVQANFNLDGDIAVEIEFNGLN